MTNKKKIGLLMQSKDWMGGVIYIQNIINSIRFLPIEERPDLTLFVWENTPNEIYENIDKNLFKLIIIPKYSKNFSFRLKRFFYNKLIGSFDHEYLIKIFKHNKIEIIYPYYNLKKHIHLKYISWIQDFQHKYLPEMFSQEEVLRRDKVFLSLAESADRVVLSSKDAKKNFDFFYPNQQYKSVVMSFASYFPDNIFDNNPLSIKKKYDLPDKFLLVANQFWKHKNHITIFRTIHELKEKGLDIPLVCTGELKDYRHKDYINQLKEYIIENNMSSNINILGLISRYDQLQIMRLSAAIVQPSLFEGWSTVIEDGRALGKRMFISDIPVHIEQNPVNAVYFRAKSKESLMEKLEENWDKLSPGPDLMLENTARMKSRELMTNFANNFLEIMND